MRGIPVFDDFAARQDHRTVFQKKMKCFSEGGCVLRKTVRRRYGASGRKLKRRIIMSNNAPATAKPLSNALKFWYGAGDFGFTLMTNVETFYFNAFLTNVAGFSTAMAGTIASITSLLTLPCPGSTAASSTLSSPVSLAATAPG